MKKVISGKKTGPRQFEMKHIATGSVVVSDAPVPYGGHDSSFHPTDLLATALASCSSVMMALIADKQGLHLDGMNYEVSMKMDNKTHTITDIKIEFHLPAAINADKRSSIENAINICPVHNALNPNIKIEAVYHYDIQ